MSKISFAHISDTHFESAGSSEFVKKVSKEYSTKQKLIDLLQNLPKVDFILLTGDLVHEGDVEDYREYRKIFDTYAPSTPLFCTMGNHDKRPQFAEGFLGLDVEDIPYLYTVTYNDLRIICLDSTFDFGTDGHISSSQTKWLKSELSTPYGRGTIILSHHPFTGFIPKVCTEVSDEFREIIKDSDVIGFFNGHVHNSAYSFYLGRPHITSESMSFGIDMRENESIYTNRMGYSLCSIDGQEITIAAKVIPSYFTELLRKNL